MDVISMQQAGIDTAVCACGTALTPDQVRLISEYAEPTAGTGTHIKYTASALHAFYNGSDKFFYLWDASLYGISHFMVLGVDFLKNLTQRFLLQIIVQRRLFANFHK